MSAPAVLRGSDDHGPLLGLTVVHLADLAVLRAGWRLAHPDGIWVPMEDASFEAGVGEPTSVVLYTSPARESHALNAAAATGGTAAEVRLINGQAMIVMGAAP